MLKVTCNGAFRWVQPHNQREKEEKENEAGDEFRLILKQFHVWFGVQNVNRKVKEKNCFWGVSLLC